MGILGSDLGGTGNGDSDEEVQGEESRLSNKSWANGAAGWLGGIFGGIGGFAGALPQLWCTLRGWDKDTQRGVMQVFNIWKNLNYIVPATSRSAWGAKSEFSTLKEFDRRMPGDLWANIFTRTSTCGLAD